jgi:hypothetical protein
MRFAVSSWSRTAAEGRTGEVLKELESEGWQVRRDDQQARGNMGHVVSGPAGVFLLETRSLPGRISVQDGVLTAHSRDDDETVWSYRGLRGRLLAATKAMSTRAGVHAVVVLWGDVEQPVVEDRGLAYVHGHALVSWLRTRHELQRVA